MAETILIIDKNETIRQFLSDYLKREYKTIASENSEDAWRKIVKGRIPDLILCDIKFSKKEMRNFEKLILNLNRQIPIIVIGDNSNYKLIIDCLEKGAFDFINKPFQLRELMLRVERGLKVSEVTKGKQQHPLLLNKNGFEANLN